MVPTCKNVTPYSPTPLNVGTMVNAPLCKSLYFSILFMPSVHPYYVRRKFLLSFVSALFIVHS